MDDSLALVTIECPDCGPGYAPLEVVTLRVNIENGAATMALPCSLCGVRAALALSDLSGTPHRAAGQHPDV